MSYNSFGNARQLLSGAEVGRLKLNGTLRDDEYAYVEGDVVMAENTRTQDRRVVGRVAELLTEGGAKRVLKG